MEVRGWGWGGARMRAAAGVGESERRELPSFVHPGKPLPCIHACANTAKSNSVPVPPCQATLTLPPTAALATIAQPQELTGLYEQPAMSTSTCLILGLGTLTPFLALLAPGIPSAAPTGSFTLNMSLSLSSTSSPSPQMSTGARLLPLLAALGAAAAAAACVASSSCCWRGLGRPCSFFLLEALAGITGFTDWGADRMSWARVGRISRFARVARGRAAAAAGAAASALCGCGTLGGVRVFEDGWEGGNCMFEAASLCACTVLTLVKMGNDTRACCRYTGFIPNRFCLPCQQRTIGHQTRTLLQARASAHVSPLRQPLPPARLRIGDMGRLLVQAYSLLLLTAVFSRRNLSVKKRHGHAACIWC